MLVTGEFSRRIVFSIIVSLLTVGFTAAQISYDFDTDPKARAQKPDFYGYVPDNGFTRTILFITMVHMSSMMLSIRALGIVILGITDIQYVAILIGADVGLFLFIKLLRKDFIYWATLQGPASIWVFTRM